MTLLIVPTSTLSSSVRLLFQATLFNMLVASITEPVFCVYFLTSITEVATGVTVNVTVLFGDALLLLYSDCNITLPFIVISKSVVANCPVNAYAAVNPVPVIVCVV